MTNEELAPKEGETSAQFKARIEEKTRELKAQDAAQPVSEPAHAPVTEPQSEPDPAPQTNAEPQDKPQEPAAPSATVEPTAPSKEDHAAEEFAKKKGWKSQEDIIKSYRELEKKLGERRPPEPPLMPAYPVNNGYPPAYGYVPPAIPPSPQVINQIARMYPQLNPEDIERVAPLIADLSETIADRKFKALEERFVSSERERQKEREIERLKQDPAFQNKEVLSEIGQILDSDPRIAHEPNGLTYAFHRALAEVGRKRLEGSAPSDASSQPGSVLPTKPPTTARGTGSSNVVGKPGFSAPNQMNPAIFSGLPLAEKQKVLRSIGAIKDSD